MSHSVAIITDACQGIGQASAIRLGKDFSALVLVAQTAKSVMTGRRRSYLEH